MCVEDLQVVSERTCLAIDALQMALQFLEVGLPDRACVHVERFLALETDERCLDIQVQREFPVIEHGQQHGIVAAVTEPREGSAQAFWIAEEIAQDDEECPVRCLREQLVDARCRREACLDRFGRQAPHDRSPLVACGALAHRTTQPISPDRHTHPVALAQA